VAPFEACRKTSTTASSLSLVRFDSNDYSVPVRWAHHPIVVKGCWQEVVLCAQGQEVARHRRIWAAEQVSFEPLHYLALLERKPGAFDHARPLAIGAFGWFQEPPGLQGDLAGGGELAGCGALPCHERR